MNNKLKQKLRIIIFGTNTFAGKLFDVLLLIAILFSILIIMLDSVISIKEKYGNVLFCLEWFFTVLFSIEYIIRLIITTRSWRYATSFMGIVDLLSILPSYLVLLAVNSHYFMIIRSIRLIRVFRILKLTRFIGEANVLASALKSSRHKISVFLIAVTCVVFIIGTLMYVLEGPKYGFTSIPKSIYWAIVTLTTVGYGDISPQTPFGQFLASIVMIVGYGIIAVPTGIITSEISKTRKQENKNCFNCDKKKHLKNAKYCYLCGKNL